MTKLGSNIFVTRLITSDTIEKIAEEFFQEDLKSAVSNETPYISKAVDYLKSSRFPDGSWQQSGWHTALAIEALFSVGESKDSYFLQDGVKWLISKREKDGSWGHQIWETAHVLVALHHCKKVWETWKEGDSILADEIERRIESGLKYIKSRANWSDSQGNWQGKKWTWIENGSEFKAHSYDVATATKLFLECPQKINKLLITDSIEYLIQKLAMKETAQPMKKRSAKILLNWDHNVLNTAIVVDMLVKAANRIPEKSAKYIRNMLEAIDYLLSRRVPGSKGWGDSRHTAETVVALYNVLNLLSTRKTQRYKEYSKKIEKAAVDGIQELKELQMPNGSWYGRVESTATAIFALLYHGEKSLDQVVITIPANLFEKIKNVWEKKIYDYAWELDQYKAGVRASPDYQEIKENLWSIEEVLNKEREKKEVFKSLNKTYFVLCQVLSFVCALLIVIAMVLSANIGYIPSDFANPIAVIAMLGEIASFFLIFRMHRKEY